MNALGLDYRWTFLVATSAGFRTNEALCQLSYDRPLTWALKEVDLVVLHRHTPIDYQIYHYLNLNCTT